MKNCCLIIACILGVLVSVAIGAVAGHFHGVAVTLQSVMAGEVVPTMDLQDIK